MGLASLTAERYAALAAQVADLRSIVTKWDARLQHAGLDGSIDLAAKLAELAELLADEAYRNRRAVLARLQR